MLADKCEWATLIRKDPSLFFPNTESYQRGGGVPHCKSDLNQEMAFKIGSTPTPTHTRENVSGKGSLNEATYTYVHACAYAEVTVNLENSHATKRLSLTNSLDDLNRSSRPLRRLQHNSSFRSLAMLNI